MRLSKKKSLFALSSLIVGLILTGCGGSTEIVAGTGTESTQSVEQGSGYIKKIPEAEKSIQNSVNQQLDAKKLEQELKKNGINP